MKLYLECRCSSQEHVVRFSLEEWHNNQPELYATIHLSDQQPFWKRLISGLKYICGHRCRYGNWDEIILDPHQIPELQNLLQEYTEKHNNWIKKLKGNNNE